MNKRRLIAYLCLLLASIIWGVAGPVIKYTLFTFPPLVFLFYRFGLSAIAAIIYLLIAKPKLPTSGRTIGFILLISFLTTTVRLGLLFFGFEQTTSLSGNVISAISPLVVAFAGVLFLKEHLSRMEKIGITIALGGTLLSVAAPVFANDNSLTSTLYGNSLVFISLLVDVTSIILAKVALKKTISPVALTFIMFIVGFVTLAPPTLYYHAPISSIFTTILNAPLAAHIGVWYMAFLSGIFAYAINFKGLKEIEIGEAGVFTYLSPIWGAPISLFLLGEKVTTAFIVGSIIIASGVFIAEYRRKTKLKRLHKKKRRR